MNKRVLGPVIAMIALMPSGAALAQHANRYGGGSTYHAQGSNSTTRANGYGGEATHTAGQGTTYANKYGDTATHAEGSGTTTGKNAYGGTATHTAGQGTSATNGYGGSAYHAEGSGQRPRPMDPGVPRPTMPVSALLEPLHPVRPYTPAIITMGQLLRCTIRPSSSTPTRPAATTAAAGRPPGQRRRASLLV